MKKINIAELLKDCPEGTELWSPIFGTVRLKEVIQPNKDGGVVSNPIVVDTGLSTTGFSKYGLYDTMHSDTECTLFPSKENRDWSAFHEAFNLKDGDIMYIESVSYEESIIIFKEIKNGNLHKHVGIVSGGFSSDKHALCHLVDIKQMRLATNREKEKLFNAIKENGYSWNPETKTLEKLVEPRFKVGNRIRRKDGIEQPLTISSVSAEYYMVQLKEGEGALCVADQDLYELAPDKFDITTLDPFESRVLVRDNERQYWKAAFWGFFGKGEFLYDTTRGIYKQCIPYEGNEHLLGKTDDCDEFYKTWK